MRPSDYKLLIFRLGWHVGRLHWSRLSRRMHVASERSGFPLRDDFAVKGIIGLGLPEAIRTLYPDIGDAELVAFRQHYADHYVASERRALRRYLRV